ncbi:MAG TPA: septum site-determining protein Ssd [Pseudonocardiaceae bacterium]
MSANDRYDGNDGPGDDGGTGDGNAGPGAATTSGTRERSPVVMMAPGALADELLRLAAAAGCEPEWVAGPDELRERWITAPLLLLDADAAECAASAGLPRRDGVVLVATASEPELWRRAVAAGAEHVAVLPDAEAWLVGAFSDAVEASGAPGGVLAVLGGRGGAGASVFAVAAAVAAVESGRRSLLVDCDPLGGGLDLVLGAEGVAGLRWSGLALGSGRIAAAALHAALPAPRLGDKGGLTVLACDRDGPGPDGAAVRTVCGAGRRAGEIVVCDVPRHPGESGTAALESADLAVLVVPAEVRACAAAATVAARVRRYGITPQLVVRGPAPGGLTPADVSRALDLPLLTSMRPQPGLAGALDRGAVPGRGRGPLATAARRVIDVVDGACLHLATAQHTTPRNTATRNTATRNTATRNTATRRKASQGSAA